MMFWLGVGIITRDDRGKVDVEEDDDVHKN